MDDEQDYIITLDCENCFNDPIRSESFYSTDCIVLSIENEKTGEKVEEVNGLAFNYFVYKVGERITNQKIFFCKTMESLNKLKRPGKVLAVIWKDGKCFALGGEYDRL